MICDSENLPPLVHTPQSQFTSSASRENVTSRKSVWVIWFIQAVLRRNLFRTVTSNKTSCFACRQFYHQWTDKFRCLLHSNGNCLQIYVEAVLSSSKLSPLFYSWAHLSVCFVIWPCTYTLQWDAPGCCFASFVSYLQVTVRRVTVRKVTIRTWIEY
jgi:hypothetical protein